MGEYGKEFDYIVEKAKSLAKPLRVAVAGADSENILKGTFMAEEAGFVRPVLIGNEEKVMAMLEKLGLSDRKYDLMPIGDGINPVQYAIDTLNAGGADVLARGNTQTRDFLLPVLKKENGLIEKGSLVTHVQILKVPGLDKLLGISDVTLLVKPSLYEKEKVIVNLVKALNLIGTKNPKIAILGLIESPAFHMKDTVEADTIVRNHKERLIAECEVVGPISYDLIISKEAARLKNYNCPYCGEFDGIVVPDLMSGNLLVKVLEQNAGAFGFGILVGAKIPVSISGRSADPVQTFLSLAACAEMLNK